MKIAIFSDLHVFHHFNKSQFEDIAQSFLFHLINHCVKEEIKTIYFLGDWFHIKNKLYVPPFIKSLEALRALRDHGIEIKFLVGNHDAPQMGTTDYSIMYAFEEFGKVVPLYEWEDIGENRFHFLSYTKELPQFEMSEKRNVLFGHLDINTFVMERGFECKEGFSIKDFKLFDIVFSGHFHKHQIKKNIIYIGSPYQVRFSERHDEKGFIILNTDSLNWEYNVYNKAPKFKDVDIENFDEEDISGNFIRIRTHKENIDLESIKNQMLSLGAESVDFIFEDENEERELNIIEDLTMGSIGEIASAYYDTIKEQNLFNPHLAELLDNGKLNKSDFIEIFQEIEEAHLSGWKPLSE